MFVILPLYTCKSVLVMQMGAVGIIPFNVELSVREPPDKLSSRQSNSGDLSVKCMCKISHAMVSLILTVFRRWEAFLKAYFAFRFAVLPNDLLYAFVLSHVIIELVLVGGFPILKSVRIRLSARKLFNMIQNSVTPTDVNYPSVKQTSMK